MEPPFTRERLRNIAEEIKKKQREETIQNGVDDIKHMILSHAAGQSGYRYGQPNVSRIVVQFNQFRIRYPQSMIQDHPTQKEILPEVIAKLNLMFPDSRFQIDPLDTYLIIDWS